ncbi:TagK domain-containing protein [Burkholderia cepacia]|uniref:TagK domain-containing protein n=1 Tax=Burkholderia cepacia TaxID=292 RepID=UPI003527CF33
MDSLAFPPLQDASRAAGATVGDVEPGDAPLTHLDPFAPGNDHGDDVWPNRPINIDDTDPLYMLMVEFRQALLSPGTNGMSEAGQSLPSESTPPIRFPKDEDAPPHPASYFAPEPSVAELLTARKNIDALLDSLDACDAAPLFETAQRRDILSVFAPPDLRACRAGPVARLTREEHHLIGLDSHMALPDSVEAFTSDSPDEHHR